MKSITSPRIKKKPETPEQREKRLVRCVYYAMIFRCYSPRCEQYADYGGRGISVCDRWRLGEDGVKGVNLFIADMGARPDGFTLERADNSLGYSPSNCCWASRSDQQRNRRMSRPSFDLAGIRAALAAGCRQTEIATSFGVSRIVISNISTGRSWSYA